MKRFHYKFKRALPLIKAYFGGLDVRILRFRDINKVFKDNRTLWDLPKSTTLGRFITFLTETTEFTQIVLNFPTRKETLYTWGEYSLFQIAMAIKPGAYFSHYSAMSVHNLTDQIPKTLYLNVEQPPKYHVDRDLDQQRIDTAFQKKPRVSSNVASLGDYRICLLNGMHTGRLGVIKLTANDAREIFITDIERTLIDIAVRPFYSGGVFEVLDAYRKACNKIDMEKLITMFEDLEYIYPYHQVIGFYIERSGCYSKDAIELLRNYGFKYDFYLTHQIKDPQYSERWRLFFPKGL